MTINPDAPLSSQWCLTETKIVCVSVAAFALTTCVLIILTAMRVPIGTVGYSLLTTFDLACLTLFAVAFIRRNQKVESSIRESVEHPELDSEGVAPSEEVEDVKEEEVVATPAASPFIQKLAQDLIPGMNAAEKLGLSFLKAYYRAERQNPEGSGDFRKAAAILKDVAVRLMNDKKQLIRFSLGIMALTILNRDTIGEALSLSDEEFLKTLPSFIRANEELKEQIENTRNLFAALGTSASPENTVVTKQLSTLREVFPKLREATQDYNRAKRAAVPQDIEKAINEWKKHSDVFNIAFVALLDHLFVSAQFKEEDLNEWFEHIIPPYLEKIKDFIGREIIPFILNLITQAYQDDGFLSRVPVIAIVYGATSWLGRNTAVYPLINKELSTVPFAPEYLRDLNEGIQTLLPALASPFYYGTCAAKYPFRQKVRELVESPDFNPPTFEPTEGEEISWTTYIKEYTAYLEKLTEHLDNMRF